MIANIGIPVFPILFTTLGLFIFSSATFIFIQKYHGVILSLLLSGYVLLRLVGLTHWIFAVMFIALFVFIELFMTKKK